MPQTVGKVGEVGHRPGILVAMERSRLFVAVWPPPDVVALLADTVARLTPSAPDGLRWTRPEQWHATLAFLGTQDVEATVAAFRRSNLPLGPVQAHVGPETGRFGSRIVHVPIAGLDGVAAAVRAVLPGDGLPGDGDRPFSGHLTLARADGRRRIDLSSVVGVPLSASFPVAEVTLVVSRLGRGPAAYEVVDRLGIVDA